MVPAQLRAIGDSRLAERFSLDGFRVDLNANVISQGKRTTRITPKAAAVMAYLAHRPRRAVGREELLASVWADAFPTDDVLSHAVAELRRALDDDARNSRYIETIPKVGYRLLVEPTLISQPVDAPVAREGRLRWLWVATAFVAGVGAGGMAVHLGSPQAPPLPSLNEDPLKRSFPLTAGPGPENMPAVSWDGRQVAFVASEGPGTTTDIYLKTVTGEVLRPITATSDAFEYSPTWSPDDAMLAFLRFEQGSCQVIIKPIGGGLERQLGSCPHSAITYIDWSPDGRHIAMTDLHGTKDVTSIMLLGLEDGVRRPLDYRTAREHDVQPKFSPDGRRIAFRRGVNPRSELFLVSSEGGEPVQLSDFGSRLYGFDWLPDGEHIWFCAQREGQPALWEVSITRRTVSAVSPSCPFGLSISSREPVMAFEDRGGDFNLIELTTGSDGVRETPLFSSTRDERESAYSPDQRQVVFISNRSGDDQLWLGNRDSGQAFQMTRLSGLSLGAPRFSADGQYVLFVGVGGGLESLYRLHVRSGVVERLSGAEERIRAASPMPDGRVLVTSDRSGDWQIWVLDPESRQATRLTDAGGHRGQAPGDGYVYYTKLDRYGLWRRPLDGGPESLVSRYVQFRNHELWMVRDGRLILPRSTKEDTLQVLSLPLTLEPPESEWQVLAEFPVERWPELSDLSADGRHLLMSDMQDMREDILLVVDFQTRPSPAVKP